MKCINCGSIINEWVQYCPECGCKIEQKIIEEQHTAGQEEVPDSLMSQIINGVLSLQDINGLTDDTYRNELVKRVFVYNVAVLIITISALFLPYRVYEVSSFLAAAAVFFAIIIFVDIISMKQ